MRNYASSLVVVFWTTSAFAAVGGGDNTLKNKGGDVVCSHEGHFQ